MGLFKSLFGGEERAYICTCKKVTEEELIEAIKEGNDTYGTLTKKTGAGLGMCKGKRCRAKIEEILEKNK